MHVQGAPFDPPVPQPQQPKQSSNLKALFISGPIAAAILAVGLIASSVSGGDSTAAPAATVTVTETVTAFANTSTDEPTAQPTAPANTIAEGTYRVPQDVKPGTYRTAGGSGCYWARLSSLDGNGIIANNLGDGPMTVTIRRTDKGFETARCDDWKKV